MPHFHYWICYMKQSPLCIIITINHYKTSYYNLIISTSPETSPSCHYCTWLYWKVENADVAIRRDKRPCHVLKRPQAMNQFQFSNRKENLVLQNLGKCCYNMFVIPHWLIVIIQCLLNCVMLRSGLYNLKRFSPSIDM